MQRGDGKHATHEEGMRQCHLRDCHPPDSMNLEPTRERLASRSDKVVQQLHVVHGEGGWLSWFGEVCQRRRRRRRLVLWRLTSMSRAEEPLRWWSRAGCRAAGCRCRCRAGKVAVNGVLYTIGAVRSLLIALDTGELELRTAAKASGRNRNYTHFYPT